MMKETVPVEPAPVMTTDSGILLTLLKERVPNWYRQSADFLRDKLSEIAEAVFGDASAVPGLMATVERLKAKEARDAEIAARLERYSIGLSCAKTAAAHFLTSERDKTIETARHIEELGRLERNQTSSGAIVHKFVREFPEADLLPGWPRLDPQFHPDNLEATAAAHIKGKGEYLKLQRCMAELADARKLRAEMGQKLPHTRRAL